MKQYLTAPPASTAMRNCAFCGGSTRDALKPALSKLDGPSSCTSPEKLTRVGEIVGCDTGGWLRIGTGPVASTLGRRRSTVNGGGSFNAGSIAKYDGICSAL